MIGVTYDVAEVNLSFRGHSTDANVALRRGQLIGLLT